MQFSAFRDKAGKLSCEPLELRGHEMRPLASQTVGKFYCAFDCGICFVDEHHGAILHLGDDAANDFETATRVVHTVEASTWDPLNHARHFASSVPG